MTAGISTNDRHWCRIQTDEPVKIGTILKAIIVGVRNNGADREALHERPAESARGREIVAWRGIDGLLQLSEARCPHQFVHLASSGTVDGCELVCTAHFWRFAANGEGSIRDASGKREQVSALIVFPTLELPTEIWGYLPDRFVVINV